MLREEDIKKGVKIECLEDCYEYFTKGKVYTCSQDGLSRLSGVRVTEDDKGRENGWTKNKFKLYNSKQDTMYNEHYPNKVDTFTRFKDLAKDTPLDPYEFVCQFNIDKYNLRMGKKEDKVKEINKIINYANEWLKYLDGKGENK